MKKILSIIILFSLFSCNDWLEIKPKGKVIPTKVNDFRLMMDFATIRDNKYGVNYTIGDIQMFTDDYRAIDKTYDGYFEEYQRKLHDLNFPVFTGTQPDKDWEISYNMIFTDNYVIENVLDSEGNEAEKEMLYAEAKVHRAFNYLMLVNKYAKHYNSKTASSDMAVPLLLSTDPEQKLARADVQTIYDRIISDVKEVIEYLPDYSEKNVRPSKGAAHALLSRAYLFMGDYANSLKNAEAALKLNDFLYDYNEFDTLSYANVLAFPKPIDDKEIILTKEPASSGYPMIGYSLKACYDTENDLRYFGNFDNFWEEPTDEIMYYRVWTEAKMDFGPTVSEMYLNKAECMIRMDSQDYKGAIDIINKIAEKRYAEGTYTPISKDITRDEALTALKLERRRELPFKGVRLFDLKRYALFDNDVVTITRSIHGKSFSFKSNDARLIFPIIDLYNIK